MGCCASSNRASPSPHFHRQSSPPPLEEEAVKEVLSETPLSKLYPKIEDEAKKPTSKQTLKKIHEEDNNVGFGKRKKPTLNIHTQDVPISEEVSEICSTMNESVSTTMFNEEDGEVRQGMTERSPAKLRRERVVGKSPVRGSEQSPGRFRSVSGRESRGLVQNSQRRDFPESSGHRSRSPANHTAGVGGRNGIGSSPSARNTGRSPGRFPGRVGSDLHERKNRKGEVGASGREEWPPTTTNESLENPLVSLECFIFL